MLSFCNPLCKDRQGCAAPRAASLLPRRLFNVTLARFTVELQARRGLLSFSRGEKVAGTAG